jgi:hypothetical protein
MGLGAAFFRRSAVADGSGGDTISEPLPGQSLDHLGQRCGTGGVQIVAATGDNRENFGEGDAIGEFGIHPHRYLDHRVGHQASPGLETVMCGR